MKLFDIMKNFNEEMPPQNVDLLVCDNPADPEDRIFERVCFFRKGPYFLMSTEPKAIMM